MTLHEIVQQWLAANGFDGLYHPDFDCACKLDDLWPCGYPNGDCRAGVLVECPGEGCPGLGVLGHYHIGSRDIGHGRDPKESTKDVEERKP